MTQLSQNRYKRLTQGLAYGQSDGLYWDSAQLQLVLVMGDSVVARVDAAGIAADLEFSGETRGDILRRGASGWERHVAKTSGQLLLGDGTDIKSQAVTGDVALSGAGAATVVGLTFGSDARGDIARRNAASWGRYSAKTAGAVLVGDGTDLVSAVMSGDVTISGAGVTAIGAGKVTAAMASPDTSIDFTQANEAAIFAKTTGAVKTPVNAQQDFFWVGNPPQYFEIAQGVGALGANTLLAANGLTPSTQGWLLICDNTATDGIEITQGIVLGAAKSYTTGTSPAFTIKAAFLVPTRANVTHFGVGFRKLVPYEAADTYIKYQTAYDDKAMIGFKNNAGAFSVETSKATVDVSTSLAHAANVNGDVMALQVLVDGSGNATYKIATVTPAGSTAAQMQAAVVAAYAALAADGSAVAFQFNAGTVLVPSILLGASGAAAPDIKVVNYFCGLQ